MEVISIGSDRELFNDSSPVQKRILAYGLLFDGLHIVVFTKKGYQKKVFGNVHIYPTNSISRWLFVFDAYRVVKKITNEQKLKPEETVLTSQDPFESGLAGYLAKRKFGFRLQLQIHTDFLNPYFSGESFLNKIRVRVAYFLIPKADCLRTVSKRVRDSLNKILPGLAERTALLPIFVDCQGLRNAPVKTDLHKKYKDNDFIILMASRFTREKNISLAVSVMPDIVKRYPQALLLIVGEGPEKENLRAEISKLKMKGSVILGGWTDNLASYYKTADLFLITSDYEGYARTAVEALSCGLPVLMTGVGVAGDIVREGDNGIIVPPRDRKNLIRELLGLMANRELYEKMKIKLKYEPYASGISWEQYLEHYKKAIISC